MGERIVCPFARCTAAWEWDWDAWGRVVQVPKRHTKKKLHDVDLFAVSIMRRMMVCSSPHVFPLCGHHSKEGIP